MNDEDFFSIKTLDELANKIIRLEYRVDYLGKASQKVEFETDRTLDSLLEETMKIRHAIRTLDEKIVSLNKRVDNCRKYMPEVGEDVE